MRITHWLLCAALLLATGCADDKEETTAPTPVAEPDDEPHDRPIMGTAIEDIDIGDIPLTNTRSIVHAMGLAAYHQAGHRGQQIRIAVLDNGFMGSGPAKGVRLPPSTMLLTAPGNSMSQSTHGTKMAEIAYAVASGSSQYVAGRPGPQIYLLNTNGFTNFKWAIDEVIRLKVDLVLYAQVWEYGGNVDGEGFINAEVQRALNAGITWINAAGNFGLGTYHGPVRIDRYLNAVLPHEEKYVRLHVPQNFTPVKIVLAWNDFTESPDYSTRQDLDIVLEDLQGNEVAASRLLQEGRAPLGDARYSSHAREIIRETLDKGEYRLRVIAKSDNFDSESRLRITADGLGVTLLDRSESQSVLMPADHRGVITIGASDSAVTGKGFDRHKPEMLVPSAVVFADGTRITGTSAASAIAAGAIAVHMGATGLRGRSNLLLSPYLQQFMPRRR